MNLKQNKGIGLADVIIAIGILIIFSGLIMSISYNIYLSSNFVKRNSNATNYIVDLFEYSQTLAFDQITTQNLNEYVKGKGVNITQDIESVSKGYNMKIEVKDLGEQNEKYEKGYIKQINVTVAYKLGKNNIKTINMSTLVNR